MASSGNAGGGGGASTPSGNHSVRSSSGAPRVSPPSLLCNRCNTPLATTCFLCACDCIFCEGESQCFESCFQFQLVSFVDRFSDFFLLLNVNCLFLNGWLVDYFYINASNCTFGDLSI